MRPDAHRWIRPDAARFLVRNGTASVYSDVERKYSPTQPRVPAGSGRESGRWTHGSSGGIGTGGAITASPMGNIDFGDCRTSVMSSRCFRSLRTRPTMPITRSLRAIRPKVVGRSCHPMIRRKFRRSPNRLLRLPCFVPREGPSDRWRLNADICVASIVMQRLVE